MTQAQRANEVLRNARNTLKSALNKSNKQRNAMLAAIERGEEPEGYRVDYIKDAAKTIVSLMGIVCSDFDKKYLIEKGDCFSQADLSDVLMTALSILNE